MASLARLHSLETASVSEKTSSVTRFGNLAAKSNSIPPPNECPMIVTWSR